MSDNIENDSVLGLYDSYSLRKSKKTVFCVFYPTVSFHRPQSPNSRVEEELIQKSSRAVNSTNDPIEKLRLLCLSRGASGIIALGRSVNASEASAQIFIFISTINQPVDF